MRSATPQSPRLLVPRSIREHGFSAAFTTRLGGVSAPPFASLNLGASVGDDPRAVRENHRRVAAELGYDAEALHTVFQVHGRALRVVTAETRPDEGRAVEADALVAKLPGAALGVRVADCVPVLVADPETGAVAAIHAGWKGVVARVIDATLDALACPSPERLVVAVGPHIGPCCFEVGPEVADALVAVSHPGVRLDRPARRPHADLGAAVTDQLRRRGVTAVEPVGGCTVCNVSTFFSYRHEGPQSGRMMGLIVSRAPR